MDHVLLGACGLRCDQCPARTATLTRDADLARRTAAEWSQAYGVKVEPDDVWCDGCMVPGRKCAHCAECEIRTCAIARNVDHCGHCAGFPCAQVEAFFVHVPAARDNLLRVRAADGPRSPAGQDG
jgi:hypothetical protein